MFLRYLGISLGLLFCPGVTTAAGPAADHLKVEVWSVLPFAGLLLSIALFPLVAEHFWHKNRNKALIASLFSLPVILYLLHLQFNVHQPGLHALLAALHEYIAFIILLGSLYTVSGGIVVDVNSRPSALVNGTILAFGTVLANLIGTTGASMLLIRPFLRINKSRKYTAHLPIFFIFTVSNLGGLLTPLGDPPLFLGFLRGVDFFWTLQLWPQWVVANAMVLVVFLVWDTLALKREDDHRHADLEDPRPTVQVRGWINLLFLGGIVWGVFLKSIVHEIPFEQVVAVDLLAGLKDVNQEQTVRFVYESASEGTMILMGLLSLWLTPRGLRQANAFSWGAIIEVAVLFIGIFITMVPALVLLETHGGEFGLTEPWQYFWLTGVLSSFLDNAPTYLTFATMASGAHDLPWLMRTHPDLLSAISCGAVFMGANTYIGNGPNFMVKAIAEESGYRTPSFFGYMVYSGLILLPIFGVITWLFFNPAGPPIVLGR